MKKIISIIIISIIIVIFLLGFIDINEKSAEKSDAELIYSINYISDDLKSVGNLDKRQQDIICATSIGLIEIDSKGEILPSLAEGVEILDEGIEYNFKIREDLYWSDGNKITPQDIAIFFRELLTEETQNDALLNIFGVSEFLNSNKSFNETVGISTTDTNFIVRLNSPDEDFLMELSKPQYRLRKNLLLWQNINDNYTIIPYSGAYSISNITLEKLELIRNDKSNITLPQSIKVVKDEGEDLALAAFEIGNRDLVINPPANQLERLDREDKIITLPSGNATYLAFNMNNDFTINTKSEIYRYINAAVLDYEDKNSIYTSSAECSYFRNEKEDLSKLQERNVMINIDNYSEDEDVNSISLVAEENLKNKYLVEFLSQWFENNTDITLITTLISKDEMDRLSEKSYYDIALININTNLNDENNFFNNIINYLPEDLKTKASTLITVEEKEGFFLEIEDILFNNYILLPLLFYNENIAINNDMKNICLDGHGNISFTNLVKK